MEILEQVTPSGIATDSGKRDESKAGSNLVLITPRENKAPREFNLEEEKATNLEDKNLNFKEHQDRSVA